MSDQGFDLGGLLQQAQEMQQRMVDAQAEVASTVVEGESGGGVVKVAVTCALEFRSVTIDPKAVDPDDVELLEDLVLAAINDAVARAHQTAADAMAEVQGDMGELLQGLGGMGGAGGLPGLPGLPGAG